MKIIKQGNLQGRAASVVQGCVVKLGGLLLGGALLLALAAPTPVKADAGAAMTQLQYIKWLVQITDSGSQFSVNSTAADYVQWARDNGMNPKDGWQPTALLTREVLAMTLGQLYGIKAKKEADYIRALEREGVTIPTEPTVTQAAFVGVVDEFGFPTLAGKKAKKKKTILCPPKKPGQAPKLKSKCTPPKDKGKPKTEKPKTIHPPRPRDK